ncbi:MAG: hypothetical protein ACRD0K_05090 [Egibacteraceae bacterium]
MAMRTPTTAIDTLGITADPERPYQDYSVVQIFESLEAQHDSGEPYREAMVWELVARAGELEELKRRYPRTR